MQIKKYSTKNEFDILIDSVDKLEYEKYNLFANILMFNTYIASIGSDNPGIEGFIENVYEHAKESIDAINKEQVLCRKMLRYIKLMKFNDCYERYSDSYHNKLFHDLIDLMKVNKKRRNTKTNILFTAIEETVKRKGLNANITIDGDPNGLNSLLTDEVYNNLLNKIPKR